MKLSSIFLLLSLTITLSLQSDFFGRKLNEGPTTPTTTAPPDTTPAPQVGNITCSALCPCTCPKEYSAYKCRCPCIYRAPACVPNNGNSSALPSTNQGDGIEPTPTDEDESNVPT